MKLDYRISFADFRSLYAPLPPDPKRGVGLRSLLALFGSMSMVGVVLMLEREISAGAWLVGVGTLGLTGCYFAEKRRIHRARKKYEEDILFSYSQTHCVDGRALETDEKGYSLTCKCGGITRSWSGLVSLSENARVFRVVAKNDLQVIPKTAFPSDGAVTEFRALVSQKLNTSRPLTARSFEFTLTAEDSHHAQRLHFLRGGGWRVLIRPAIVIAVLSAVWATPVLNRNIFMAIAIGLALICTMVIVVLIGIPRKKRYGVPLRVYFSEEGLHLQDSASEARTSWEQFLGYLADSKVFLFYYNPKLYRIIPKRALVETGDQFSAFVYRKLMPYDYREPFASIKSRAAGPASGSSASPSLFP